MKPESVARKSVAIAQALMPENSKARAAGFLCGRQMPLVEKSLQA
jgi:hypothetical protein